MIVKATEAGLEGAVSRPFCNVKSFLDGCPSFFIIHPEEACLRSFGAT